VAKNRQTTGSMPGQEQPPFGHSVGFLLSQLGFETARRFGELMREIDLEPRQFALMRMILQLAGHSQNAVAERLRIPRSSMVSVIDSLEERGLVERRPHPSDRRTHSLFLTVLGEQILARGTDLAMGFESVVCRGFEPAEREELISRLCRVADNLGLAFGLHPDTSTGHGRPHWTEAEPAD
jgi:DNA-binding MarR family transcriptional regulator